MLGDYYGVDYILAAPASVIWAPVVDGVKLLFFELLSALITNLAVEAD